MADVCGPVKGGVSVDRRGVGGVLGRLGSGRVPELNFSPATPEGAGRFFFDREIYFF